MSKKWYMRFSVSKQYFVMPSNAHPVRWQSLELKIATRWYVTIVGSISATDAIRQLMDMTTSGTWFTLASLRSIMCTCVVSDWLHMCHFKEKLIILFWLKGWDLQTFYTNESEFGEPHEWTPSSESDSCSTFC